MSKRTKKIRRSRKPIKAKSIFSPVLIISLLVFAIIIILLINLSSNKKFASDFNNIVYGSSYNKINMLVTEVQIGYFEGLLGKPIFVNKNQNKKTIEHIFVKNNFFVQAITDSDNKVLSFAVTTRNNYFKPKNKEGIILGESTLASAAKQGGPGPNKCYSFLSGATAPSFYFEQYYFGNPENYQNYFYGYNEEGYFDKSNRDSFPTLEEYLDANTFEIDCTKISPNLRDKFVINTFMVVAPFVEFKDLEIDFQDRYFGVNPIQVRLLP